MKACTCVVIVSSLVVVTLGGAVLPDRCACSADRAKRGAQCMGSPTIDCGFSGPIPGNPGGDAFADMRKCLQELANFSFIKNLTLTNGEYGLVLNDPEYIEIGALLGVEPLASQLTSITVLDQREFGCTQSDAGLSGFALGLVNSTALEALRLDFRQSNGLGTLGGCPNQTNLSSSLPIATGLEGLGMNLARIPTLRSLDLNFDGHLGGYSICEREVVGFANNGLKHMRLLEQLTLGLNFMDIGDEAASMLGTALATLPLLGVNLRLKGAYVTKETGGVTIGAQGVTDLMLGLSNISTLQSLALMLGDGEKPLDTAAYNSLGQGFAKMLALEYLWLYLGDEVTQIDKSGLITGLGHVKTLKVTHSDIHCLQCTGTPPFVCRNDGALSSVLAGACIDCTSYPRPNQCDCWEKQSYGCSDCDRAKWVSNHTAPGTAGCTDTTQSLEVVV